MSNGVSFTYQIQEKSIGGFVIDVFEREDYSFSNSVTDIPVEEGSNVSDNVIEDQDTISIQAFIGNAEFKVWEGEIPTDLSTVDVPDKKTRIRHAYHELLRLKRERQPVDVVMGLDTFTDMMITSFQISRDVETGANLPFTMEFKKIKIVKSETTTINSSSSSASDQVAGTSSVGVAGKQKTDDDSNLMKERWRAGVKRGDWSAAEYQAKWGVPYPQ